MNYRRGFQRIYAVLAVVWIASMLVVIPSSQRTFWIPDIDYDALAKQAGEVESTPVPMDIWGRAALMGQSQSRLHKCLWLVGVLFSPPVVGYILLFLVVPWIYRGFRTVTKTS